MKRLFALLLLALAPLLGHAQQRTFNQAELDALVAPVALYPDAVLGQVLVAATYPHQVAEAAAWSRAHPHLAGDDAVRASQPYGWHPAVNSLVAYPDLLARMADSPQWVRDLGEAYALQEPYVLDTVQQLRRRAEASGYLRSDAERHVYREEERIVVQPAHAQVVYIPYYNPLVVFGPWWWASYRPVFWRPWHARPVHSHWQAWHHHHHQRHRAVHARSYPRAHSQPHSRVQIQQAPVRIQNNGAPSVAAQQQAADTARYIERQRAANQPSPAVRQQQQREIRMPAPGGFSQHRSQVREERHEQRREAHQHRKDRRG